MISWIKRAFEPKVDEMIAAYEEQQRQDEMRTEATRRKFLENL